MNNAGKRKEALRDDVDAMIIRLMKEKEPEFVSLHLSQTDKSVISIRYAVDYMWHIIDKLVDEVESLSQEKQ